MVIIEHNALNLDGSGLVGENTTNIMDYSLKISINYKKFLFRDSN
jgi:hypothetical protein